MWRWGFADIAYAAAIPGWLGFCGYCGHECGVQLPRGLGFCGYCGHECGVRYSPGVTMPVAASTFTFTPARSSTNKCDFVYIRTRE